MRKFAALVILPWALMLSVGVFAADTYQHPSLIRRGIIPTSSTSSSSTDAGVLTLQEALSNGDNYVKITVPDAITTNYTLRLPDVVPDGKVLQFASPVDGVSEGSWVPVGGTVTGMWGNIENNGQIAATTTSYGGIGNSAFSTAISFRQWLAPFAGTITALHMRTGGTQDASGTLVCSANINGSNQADVQLTFANADGASPTKSDTGSVAFASGDLITISCTNNASVNSTYMLAWSFKYTVTP